MLKITDLSIIGLYNLLISYNEYITEFIKTYKHDPDFFTYDLAPVSIGEFLNNDFYLNEQVVKEYIIVDTTLDEVVVTDEDGEVVKFDDIDKAYKYANKNIQYFQVVPLPD